MVPALVLLGGLPLLLVVPRERVLDAFDHALRLAVAVVAAELGQPGRLRLCQVEPVDGLGEAQVGVDARDDDAGVDGDQLDADDRDPDVGVDDEALVQDQVDDVGEPARARGALEVVARRSVCCDSHRSSLPRERCLALAPMLGTLALALLALAVRDPGTGPGLRRLPAAADGGDGALDRLLRLVKGAAVRRELLELRQQRSLDEARRLARRVGRDAARRARRQGDEHPLCDRPLLAASRGDLAGLLLRLVHDVHWFHPPSCSLSSSPERCASSLATTAATPVAAAAATAFAAVRRGEPSLPGRTFSSAPSIAPFVISSAPFSWSSGRPESSVCARSRRLTASAKRR